MIKKILILSLLLLLVACGNEVSESTKEIPKDITPKCPSSCDDNNVCTIDSCSSETNYQCVHEGNETCCGDGLCNNKENSDSCREDCPIEVNLESLKEEINEIYSRKDRFDKNKLKFQHREFLKEDFDKYEYYDSTFVLIIKVIDEELKEKMNDNFEVFLEDYAAEKYVQFLKESFSTSRLITDQGNYTDTHDEDLYEFAYYGKEYNNLGELQGWFNNAIIYYKCTDDMFVEVYSKSFSDVDFPDWNILTEQEMKEALFSSLSAKRNNALEEAGKIKEFCNG